MKSSDDQLFDDPHASKQKARDLYVQRQREAAYRIAQKLPQAIIKVASYAHDAQAVGDTLAYISRDGGLMLEDPEGNELDQDEVKERLKDWQTTFDTHRKRSRESMHMVFSSPAGSDPEAVKEAVRQFTWEVFGPNHDYLFALHEDTDNPHVHLCVKMKGYDGQKLDPHKADLRQWRVRYAQQLREAGIEVDASSRIARGVAYTPDTNKTYHIFKRGQLPRHYKKMLAKVKEDAEKGRTPRVTPGVERAKKHVERYRQTYRDVASSMITEANEGPGDLQEREVLEKKALKIFAFADRLPAFRSTVERLYEQCSAEKTLEEPLVNAPTRQKPVPKPDHEQDMEQDLDQDYDLDLDS